MKKLIAVATLFFAFTISANAQDKKSSQLSSSEAAQKDVAALVEKISLNENFKKDMYTLMTMKHDQLSQAKTKADKDQISAAIEHKILSGLNKEQRQVLTNDPALLKQLTH